MDALRKKAMMLRHDAAIALLKRGELGPAEALALVVAPPPRLEEASRLAVLYGRTAAAAERLTV